VTVEAVVVELGTAAAAAEQVDILAQAETAVRLDLD
jgi:hypothetical protein